MADAGGARSLTILLRLGAILTHSPVHGPHSFADLRKAPSTILSIQRTPCSVDVLKLQKLITDGYHWKIIF